jgi:hypothetical protein
MTEEAAGSWHGTKREGQHKADGDGGWEPD